MPETPQIGDAIEVQMTSRLGGERIEGIVTSIHRGKHEVTVSGASGTARRVWFTHGGNVSKQVMHAMRRYALSMDSYEREDGIMSETMWDKYASQAPELEERVVRKQGKGEEVTSDMVGTVVRVGNGKMSDILGRDGLPEEMLRRLWAADMVLVAWGYPGDDDFLSVSACDVSDLKPSRAEWFLPLSESLQAPSTDALRYASSRAVLNMDETWETLREEWREGVESTYDATWDRMFSFWMPKIEEGDVPARYSDPCTADTAMPGDIVTMRGKVYEVTACCTMQGVVQGDGACVCDATSRWCQTAATVMPYETVMEVLVSVSGFESWQELWITLSIPSIEHLMRFVYDVSAEQWAEWRALVKMTADDDEDADEDIDDNDDDVAEGEERAAKRARRVVKLQPGWMQVRDKEGGTFIIPLTKTTPFEWYGTTREHVMRERGVKRQRDKQKALELCLPTVFDSLTSVESWRLKVHRGETDVMRRFVEPEDVSTWTAYHLNCVRLLENTPSHDVRGLASFLREVGGALDAENREMPPDAESNFYGGDLKEVFPDKLWMTGDGGHRFTSRVERGTVWEYDEEKREPVLLEGATALQRDLFNGVGLPHHSSRLYALLSIYEQLLHDVRGRTMSKK